MFKSANTIPEEKQRKTVSDETEPKDKQFPDTRNITSPHFTSTSEKSLAELSMRFAARRSLLRKANNP